MQGLENRIQALEQAKPDKHNILILVRFQLPGKISPEIRRISTASDFIEGETWIQLEGESGKEFTGRVHTAVRGSRQGPMMVFADHYHHE